MFNAFHTNSCLLGKTILFKSYAKGIVSADFKCLALNFHKFVYAINGQADLVITTVVRDTLFDSSLFLSISLSNTSIFLPLPLYLFAANLCPVWPDWAIFFNFGQLFMPIGNN